MEGATPETSALVKEEHWQLCQAHSVAQLAIALGKTIAARASEVLAIDAQQERAAIIVTETEARVASSDRYLHPLWTKIHSERRSHSEQEVERIAKIGNLLRKPFLDEKWLHQKGLSLDGQIPIDVMACDLAGLTAVTCDWAVSVATVGDVPSALEQRLDVVISIEKFIIELANALGEEARGLARLRNPERRDRAIGRIKRLIEDIKEAGRSLADEAFAAPSVAASPVFTPQSTSSKARSRLPLYHGTSAKRLKQILEDGCLGGANPEDPDHAWVSLTLDRNVAEYFACRAALLDAGKFAAEGNAVVLELDGYALSALLHELSASEVGWEREVTCSDIEQLDRVLIAQEQVPPERFADFLRLGRKAFMPTSELKPDFALQLNQLLLHDQAKSAPKWWH